MYMRSYEEICDDLRNAKPGKEARKLHRELKHYGDRIDFLDRYPYLLLILSVLSAVALSITAIGLVLLH